MSEKKPEKHHVAAVCGNEMRVYGAVSPLTQRRPLVRVIVCKHAGQARFQAQEFDDAQQRSH